jgi:ketosteroid isomerase-like protein
MPKTAQLDCAGALWAAVFVSTLAACEPRDQPQPAQRAAMDTAAARASIDTLRATYERAVASGNFENMGAMLADGAVMVRPGGPQWDSLFGASALPFPPGSTIDIEPIEVQIASNEWAYEFGNSTVTYTPEGSSDVRSLKDTYIVIFRNTGNGWKVYREVASSNLPPAGR